MAKNKTKIANKKRILCLWVNITTVMELKLSKDEKTH